MRSSQQNLPRFKFKPWLAATLLASLPLALPHIGRVAAAGLGNIHVISQLGQPFVAEIDLINVTKEELATLRVNLAPTAAYQAANLRFDPALNALRLSVERRANGKPYIRATSTRSVSEPYLDLLVEINWQDGKIQRGYAALLDLPETKPAAVAAASAVASATSASSATNTPPDARNTRDTRARAPRPSRNRTRPAATPATSGNDAVPVIPAIPAIAASKPVEPVKAEPAKPDTAKPPMAAAVIPATPVAPVAETPAVTEAPRTEPPKPESREAAVVPPLQQPAPRKAVTPTPPAPPGVLDGLMKYFLLIGGIVLALLAGLATWWASRRRKSIADDRVEHVEIIESVDDQTPTPALAAQAVAAPIAAVTTATAAVIPPLATVADVTDAVDPIDEANVYLEYGQNEEAEKLLREALNKEPARDDIQMLLLEILAKRGDTDGFNQLAGRMHRQTGGRGAHWKHAMAMGYKLDPSYPLYSPTDDGTAPAIAPIAMDQPGATPAPVDLDVTLVMPTAHAPIEIEPPTALAKSLPDLDFELTTTDAATPAEDQATLDFNTAISNSMLTLDEPSAKPAAKAEATLDFQLELPGANLTPKDAPQEAPAIAPVTVAPAPPAEPIREEVQQKLDLARAYQAMGDKDGALELLREIESEGNPAEQAEARYLLHALEQTAT